MLIHYSLIGLSVLFFNCNWSLEKKRTTSETIRSVKLIYTLPALDRDGNLLFQINDSIQIHSYGKLLMYRFPYHFDSSQGDKLLKDEIRYGYFVFNRDSAYGFNYDDKMEDKNKRLPVDSLLQRLGFSTLNLYEFFRQNLLKPIYRDSASGILEERYVRRIDPTNLYKDTVFLYFADRFIDIPFSLSKPLDSLKQLKLFKARIVMAPEYLPEYKVTLAARDIRMELKPLPAVESQKALSYFERYKQQFKQ